MRTFDEADTMFILENDNKMSLAVMAEHFGCSPNELYEYYNKLLYNGRIRVHMQQKMKEYKRQKELFQINNLMRKEGANEPIAIT